MSGNLSEGEISEGDAAASRKYSHRVIFEEIAQNKKLKTYLSFSLVAPEGFTFIPAGDPQLTRRCKEISKRDGHAVFIVSSGIRAKFELSREINRVGHHFSNLVIEKAGRSLNVTINAAGKVSSSQFASIQDEDYAADARPHRSKRLKLVRNGSPKLDTSLDQAIIDTQAREAIQDLFPKIPQIDLHEIISRAFDKTRGLVGTASGTSLVRRANLAVVAHIRHTYTNYDELLRNGVERAEARKGVEQFILDKLLSWREDDEEDAAEIEDVLREVVIISDDEGEQAQPSVIQSLREDQTLQRLGDEYIVLGNEALDGSESEAATKLLPSSGPNLFQKARQAKDSDARQRHRGNKQKGRSRIDKVKSRRPRIMKTIETDGFVQDESRSVHVVRLNSPGKDARRGQTPNRAYRNRRRSRSRHRSVVRHGSMTRQKSLPVPNSSGSVADLFIQKEGSGKDLMATLVPAKTPLGPTHFPSATPFAPPPFAGTPVRYPPAPVFAHPPPYPSPYVTYPAPPWPSHYPQPGFVQYAPPPYAMPGAYPYPRP